MKVTLNLFFLTLIVFTLQSQDRSRVAVLDSILQLRKLSNDSEIKLSKRFDYAVLACEISDLNGVDSTRLKSMWNLSRLYLYYDRNEQFGELNKEILKLSQTLNDTIKIASTHHNLGYYYDISFKSDSAYYHYYNAAKLYNEIGELKEQAITYLSLANIQEVEKDYVGSQENIIKAIKLFEQLESNPDNNESMADLYTLLAINEHRLGNYEEAIRNYSLGIDYSIGTSSELFYSLNNKNNIGYSHFKKGEFSKALDLYNEVIEYDSLLQLDTSLYVTVLGNIGNSMLALRHNDMDNIERVFKEGFDLAEHAGDQLALLEIGDKFTNYYIAHNRMEEARKIGIRTLKVAREADSNEAILSSLLSLSRIEKGEKGKEYLYEHIKLSDSLLQKERSIRNKFAKIEYETDQIRAEKEQLSKERLVFLLSSIGLLVLLVLIYIIITQRSKNRQLEFNKQQQEANEEIYHLMLAQQEKVEEGRTKEKKRISQELHDGILGRLFGTRLSLDSLNLVKTDEAIKSRFQYIDELKNIEQEIRKISHDLNTDFVSGSSFNDIIISLVETQTKAYDLNHTLEVADEINWDKVSSRTKMHIYRMLQECMQNIYKHAEANRIDISFNLENDVILMCVTDDGKGFDINKSLKGIGIKNINSRVAELNGNVNISSEIGKGTTIEIIVPS